ncbi:Fibronectin type III domain-containing protein 5 [Collichthys lucidus]|uniref:Fibronectin type III domain-containing protein 5 n=1 Tax=Collichthys lucidus TaxID=240159 RepID=A0A4U5VJT1_COLLU|nr:Fibronectin type III domain-containing protein 5 [Collichthys lucidus]
MAKPGLSAAVMLLLLGFLSVSSVNADALLSAPLNVTIREIEVNSAVVTWEILEGDPVIGFAITQQKKDVRMLRFIQEVNTTTRSCALWDLDEDTEYIVHVQSISMGGSSPPSEPVLFRTPKESEKMASKSPESCCYLEQLAGTSNFIMSDPVTVPGAAASEGT